jgi:hypothetical protein
LIPRHELAIRLVGTVDEPFGPRCNSGFVSQRQYETSGARVNRHLRKPPRHCLDIGPAESVVVLYGMIQRAVQLDVVQPATMPSGQVR